MEEPFKPVIPAARAEIDNRLGAIPAGSIAICANKTWLQAVYRNLFTHDVKYGGKECTISFGFEQRESHYRLNVYNSGRPTAEEDREKLFDRFERIEPLAGPTPDGSNFVFTISSEDECEASTAPSTLSGKRPLRCGWNTQDPMFEYKLTKATS